MPFRIALSGLNAASTDLEVTGNNIANAATSGFKESRTEFADVFAASLQDTGNQSGQGVRVSNISQQFSQGTIDFTSNNLDLAISGQGFFILDRTDGTQGYTRAGAFSVDRNGYVVNASNDRLQFYQLKTENDVTGDVEFGGDPDALILPTTPNEPQPTQNIDAVLNLDATKVAFNNVTEPFDTSALPDAGDYHSSTSTTIYDSLGIAHTATMYLRKESRDLVDASDPVNPVAGTDGTADTVGWGHYLFVDGVYQGATGDDFLEFGGTGALATDPPTMSYAIDWATLDPTNNATPSTVDVDFTGTTQFGSAFSVNRLAQDGYTEGRLAGVDIDSSGIVFARYTNGQSDALGQVALARFSNQQGLRQVGDTVWAESYESGEVQRGMAGGSGFGLVQSGALESSNVDLAGQLVNLITAQRNFQANAEVISTADSVTQTIINIR
jgi:flagellar hook protein FlgE